MFILVKYCGIVGVKKRNVNIVVPVILAVFLQKRVINGKAYTYIEHSFRIGEHVQKASFILNKDTENYNEEIIQKIASAKAAYYIKHFQTFFSEAEIQEIETEKLFYQVFFSLLDEKSQQIILDEFMRLFLANSLELEGSTITPELAENIERNKKVMLPESEVKLYTNSKEVLRKAMQEELRSVIQFKRYHQDIYQGIYPQAGQFKTKMNTFGYTEKAETVAPAKVREELQKSIDTYKDKKVYPFLRPLLFHLNYQKVHPFLDGNSRLGRIILVAQLFRQGYPPFMFKGDMSFQIRETLVEHCNHGHLDFCRLSVEQYRKTSQKFWQPMIQKFLFR